MADFSVVHCPECGTIFQKGFRTMCQDCTDRLNREFQDVTNFLKRNRQVSTAELSAATNVPEARIKKWIKEQRILLYDYPNMTYDCELCGEPIRNARLCIRCGAKIKSEIVRMQDNEAKRSPGIGFRSRS